MSTALTGLLTKVDEPSTPLRRLIAQYAGPEPVCVRVMMNSDMAAEALSRNNINRPVRQRHRLFLAQQMRDGQWRSTHQGIAFSSTGKLLDGQHRLLAITDTRLDVPMQVTFNLPDDAFMAIDYGTVPRNISDVLGIPPKQLEPVVFLYRMALPSTIRTKKIGADEVKDFWWVFGLRSVALLDFCRTSTRAASSAPVRAAIILMAEATKDETFPFVSYRALVLQEYENMSASVQALNRQFMATAIAKSRDELFVRTCMALERENVTRIQIKDLNANIERYRAMIMEVVKKNRYYRGARAV